MNPPVVELNISLFADDKDLLEKIAAHRNEPLPILLRSWIRTSAHRSGLLPPDKVTPRGPTERTRIRAMIFKRLKDTHPAWSIDRVALEASRELGETVTTETVRNAYRALGWPWARADRVR